MATASVAMLACLVMRCRSDLKPLILDGRTVHERLMKILFHIISCSNFPFFSLLPTFEDDFSLGKKVGWLAGWLVGKEKVLPAKGGGGNLGVSLAGVEVPRETA